MGKKKKTFYILKNFESFANLDKKPIYPGIAAFVSALKNALAQNIQIELSI